MRILHLFICFLLLAFQQAEARNYKPNNDHPAPEYISTQDLTSDGTTVTVPLSKFLGGSSTTAFCRFYLADAQTLKPRYDLSSNFVIPAGKQALVANVDSGMVEFPRWNYTRGSIDLTLNLPAGHQWTDFVIVALKKSFTASSLANENVVLPTIGITDNVLNTLDHLSTDPNSWSDYLVYTIDNPRTTTAQRFSPYEGVISAQGDFETSALTGARRQHTHSWSYDLYAEPGTTVQLRAPIVDNEWIEYRNYWRWYDNNTFKASPRITTTTTVGNLLTSPFTDTEGRSEGLFYYTPYTGSAANQTVKASFSNMASVLYTVPDDPSWTGDDIAADASRYTDGFGYDGTSLAFREPTLSTRFVWHLHPASEIATAIKQAILQGNAYEDHGNITIALETKKSTAYSSLRLDLHDVGQYWFYPYRMGIYGQKPSDLDFNANYVQAKSVSWAVHVRNGEKLYYKFLGNGSRYNASIRYDLRAADVQGVYYNVNDLNDTIHIDTLKTGREFSIIAYANTQASYSATNLTAPVARFNCYFITAVHPQLAGQVSTHRAIERLEKNYTRVGLINFDDEQGMTFDAPTQIYNPGSTANNSWHRPLEWNRSYYGFVYPQLVAQGKSAMGYTNFGKYGAYHGDYMLVKQIGGSVSFNGGEGYRWWYGGNPVLYDRTYQETGGQRSGYLLYVDASDEARPIASLDFEANLCSGSTLILSAAVADITSGNERPQLLFKLYGVKYDEQGNVVTRQLIQSFASGDFLSHGANAKGQWYQVFAKTFIHPNALAEQFTNFTVTIDNNCRSTSGADYAIDDIRFYVANDQIEVLQLADKDDLCERKNNGAYLKLRMDYSMIRTFLQANERRKPFFYRICTADGTPVADASLQYPEDQWHERRVDANGVPYGLVWIEPTEDTNRQYLENDVYGYARFVVANTFFHLDPTKTYYFSGALPIETANADGTFSYAPGFWGNPGTPCSVYSKILNISQQDFVITNGNGQAVSKFYAECGEEDVRVSLSAKLSIPDAVYGGRKDIDWKFDWVIGGEEAFNEKFITGGLLEVIQHFRTEYPDARQWNWDFFNAYFDGVIDMDFDTGEWTVLDESRLADYGTTPPKGVFTAGDMFSLTMEEPDGSANTFDNSIVQIFMRAGNSMDHVIRIPNQGTIYTNIWYIPSPGTYTDPETGVSYKICPDPIRADLELSHLTPQLYLGFPTVTYPDDYERTAKYVRLGLRQANELKKGTLLSIPINGYRDASLNEGSDRHNLAIEEDNGNNVAYPRCVRLVSTNDPTVSDEQLATFGTAGLATRYHRGMAAMVIPDDAVITPQSQTISIDFSQNTESYSDGTSFTNDIQFHEGYDYQFVITYHDATKQIGSGTGTAICYAYTYFTLRIIPEYVTWTGAVSANTNWNNDLNWRRASRAELNLTDDPERTAVSNGKVTFSLQPKAARAASGLDASYAEYGSNAAPGLAQAPGADPSATPQAYVPMKFTKVIILPGTSFPYLGSYEVDSRQGIITNLQNPNLSEGTALIAYDLMVKPDKESGIDAYGCERFYANTCQQVYFRTDRTDLPQGEGQIRNQHYLDYRQAWVDFSIHPDRWNWFASPLHDVYAGDFYLPAATGQQATEAFQPIRFATADGYSRTAYPVYQRSWALATDTVVTADRTLWPDGWYDASVPYDPMLSNGDELPDSLLAKLLVSQWSHAYNDVTVPYLPGHGASVMPLRTDGSSADDGSALFRIPKADASYGYYDHQGNASEQLSPRIDRSLAGRLATSRTTADDPRRLTGTITLNTAELPVREGYVLVGNPYMGTLQMSSFFNDNPAFFRKYWTLDESGSLKAFIGTDNELGTVAPMRAFFIKAKAGTNPTEVRFLPSQCTTVFYATGQTALRSRTLRLTATDAHGHRSQTVIVADPEADDAFADTEDAEAFFDTDLAAADRPLLYTLAGTRAASVNRLSDLRNVPLSVVTASPADLTLTVSGTGALSAPIYLYDAERRTATPLTDGTSITLRSNAPGRYLLTSRAFTPESAVRTALRCYPTGQRGGVVASTEPTDRLTAIQAYDTLGRLKLDLQPDAPTHEFTLPKGVWLVTLTSEAVPEGRTFKLIVK